jgi:cysteine desulfurase
MDNTFIYLDHAATTPVKPVVLESMMEYFTKNFGNASSIYTVGRESKKALEISREKVAAAIGAQAREIFFTGSGSEADNWAIKGVAHALRNKGKHIITSAIEHHAVLHTCQYLEDNGFEVTYLPVQENGIVNIDTFKKAIRKDTILVSIMLANNEIGTIQPISEISRVAKENGILVHTDVVQAVGSIPVNVDDLGVDLISISAHKFYGPKGVGVLYIRKGTKIAQFIHGGAQERNKRAGTENIANIVGMAKAMELAVENLDGYSKKLINLRDKTINEVLEKIPYTRLNGDKEKRLPGNVNFSFDFIEGESLLLLLDMKGFAASSGSACTSGSLDPSHVLLAIGLPHETAHGSLRISFGEENTEEDVNKLMEVLPGIVQRLRDMSPLYEKVRNGGI